MSICRKLVSNTTTPIAESTIKQFYISNILWHYTLIFLRLNNILWFRKMVFQSWSLTKLNSIFKSFSDRGFENLLFRAAKTKFQPRKLSSYCFDVHFRLDSTRLEPFQCGHMSKYQVFFQKTCQNSQKLVSTGLNWYKQTKTFWNHFPSVDSDLLFISGTAYINTSNCKNCLTVGSYFDPGDTWFSHSMNRGERVRQHSKSSYSRIRLKYYRIDFVTFDWLRLRNWEPKPLMSK